MQVTHIESLSHLCQSLQQPFAVVARAVNELAITPAGW